MGIFKPSNFRFLRNAEDDFADGGLSPGGTVIRRKAGGTLLIGDFVVLIPGINRVHKTLSNSYYCGGLKTGIVVGGAKTDYNVYTDASAVGAVTAAVAGEDVIILTRGVAYAICDATGIKAGSPFSAGRTTAGRIRGDFLISAALNSGNLVRSAGTATLAEILGSVDTLLDGVKGSGDPAAGLDMAALVGTVNNQLWGMWDFRVAANGTTVTSAAGLLTATAKALLTLPAGVTNLAILGFIIVHPTGTGNFVGGTTALDDGTVVPNTEYYSLHGVTAPRGYVLQDGGAAGSAILVEIE